MRPWYCVCVKNQCNATIAMRSCVFVKVRDVTVSDETEYVI